MTTPSMTMPSMIAQFEEVLTSEQLADVRSAFGDPEFCDEVPLYSRYEQIAFLEQSGDVDSALIQLALDYFDRVTSAVQIAADGWAAISVIRDGGDEPIVPAVFVCCRDAAQQLSKLRLVAPPASDFGRQIRDLVRVMRPHPSAYTVFEDSLTTPDEVRVFISNKAPPLPVLRR